MSKKVEYQIENSDKLFNAFREMAIYKKPNATIVFKAPTGSGKTYMMSLLLQKLLDEPLDEEYVYIWASVGDIAHQSYLKFSNEYMINSEYRFIELEKISNIALASNTILFCNWEEMYKIKKEIDDNGEQIEVFDNHYVKMGESGRNLQNVLNLTREEGRKIVLIVDEAHHTYLGENSQKLVNLVIKPDITIEVSATPIIKLPDGYYESNVGRYVEVPFNTVKESGAIKKQTIINKNLIGEINKEVSNDFVLESALKQRDILHEKYISQGLDINPLLLIQLPSESINDTDDDINTFNYVKTFMENNGRSFENGKLAVWMSGQLFPSDVKKASVKNNSDIEVLIFKQAIALGWDCPRASVLAILREIHSVVFEIQTVGRIIRMPDFEFYKDEELNKAYIFTNINEIKLKDDLDTKLFFTMFQSKIKEGNKIYLNLPSSYRKRVVGQRHRLNLNFRPLFFDEAYKYFKFKECTNADEKKNNFISEFEFDEKALTIPILSNVIIDDLDNIDKKIIEDIKNSSVMVRADEAFIERTFNLFLKSASSPYAPSDSSGVLKRCIYKLFSEYGISDESIIQKLIACSEKNQRIVRFIIDKAKIEFEKTLVKDTEIVNNTFSLPREQEYGDGYELYIAPKHILQPYYRPKKMWETEEIFEDKIEKNNCVVWWYRNGTSEPKYFGIRYSFIGGESLFYPDYFVGFNDGTIGIFDTKSGISSKQNTSMGEHIIEKANALQKYLRDYQSYVDSFGKLLQVKERVKGLWGGIVNIKNKQLLLQGDAKTQQMALEELQGKNVNYPNIAYDSNNWELLLL